MQKIPVKQFCFCFVFFFLKFRFKSSSSTQLKRDVRSLTRLPLDRNIAGVSSPLCVFVLLTDNNRTQQAASSCSAVFFQWLFSFLPFHRRPRSTRAAWEKNFRMLSRTVGDVFKSLQQANGWSNKQRGLTGYKLSFMQTYIRRKQSPNGRLIHKCVF